METIKLYKRNNKGEPYGWELTADSPNYITIKYGILGKKYTSDTILISKFNVKTEVKSRINQKRKEGYLEYDEVRDDTCSFPVEEWSNEEFIRYLDTYLPTNKTNTNNNNILPMLAKLYTINCFKYSDVFIGQWKINGLRCCITFNNDGDMFHPYTVRIQSREGEVWNGLTDLKDYLVEVIDTDVINYLINYNIALDGEIYLPGYKVNMINHFVKDPTCPEHKLLQFWCYDIAIDSMIQSKRIDFMFNKFKSHIIRFNDRNEHLNNKEKFLILPYYDVTNDETALKYRNEFIDKGFEGLIMRNPNAEYNYGNRSVKVMLKYKDHTDGKFEVIDIYPEKTRDLPIIRCRNDINNETFETRLSIPQYSQKEVLYNKEQYIGRYVFISYGERSGVNRVPYHIKEVYFI